MIRRGLIFVIVQFACGAVLALTGPVFTLKWPGLLVLAAFGLLIWAIVTLRLHTLTAMPEIRQGATLTTAGPYRWIRHPMYTAALLLTGAWLAMDFTWWRLLIYLLLALNLIVKLHYEERLLSAHYPGYADYRKTTRKLIPFLY
jgi:protein-S-isoprenylcysteine O-methyltransferase Ste14